MGDTLPPRRGHALEGVSRHGRAAPVVARLLEGEKMAPLCPEFGILRKTGYKIFDQYKDCGLRLAFLDCVTRDVSRYERPETSTRRSNARPLDPSPRPVCLRTPNHTQAR